MGVSTDAIVFYGLLVDDDSPAFEKLSHYEETEAEEQNPLGGIVYTGHAIDGVTIVTHCSDGSPMFAVAIADSVVTAWRGHPRPLQPVLPSHAGSDAKLRAFCEKHGITWREPSWLLVSYWG